MTSVYVKLQSGERLDALREEQIAAVLQGLHPEYNARATFHAVGGEWVAVFGCVSDGFALSYQAAPGATIVHSPQMLSLSEARRLIVRFIRGEPEWQTAVRWKRNSRIVEVGIAVLVVAVVISILLLFMKDLKAWL